MKQLSKAGKGGRNLLLCMHALISYLDGAGRRKEEAITLLARMLGGDSKALTYLVSHGHIEIALSQASSSANAEGLETVASKMRQIDPCVSFLCAQARLLHAPVDARRKRTAEYSPIAPDDTSESIAFLVDHFVRDLLANQCESSEGRISFSLQSLCKMSLVGTFASAVGSTSEMQDLLEKYQALFQDESQLLGIAGLAVIASEAQNDGLNCAAERANILHAWHDSGMMLTNFNVCGDQETFAIVCATLHESSVLILKKACDDFRCNVLKLCRHCLSTSASRQRHQLVVCMC